MTDHDPAEIAAIDQNLAAVSKALDGWAAAFRAQEDKHGPDQALANISLALAVLQLDPDTMRGYLLVALHRLATPPPTALAEAKAKFPRDDLTEAIVLTAGEYWNAYGTGDPDDILSPYQHEVIEAAVREYHEHADPRDPDYADSGDDGDGDADYAIEKP